MMFNYKQKKIVFKPIHMGFLTLDTVMDTLISGQMLVTYPLEMDPIVEIRMLGDLTNHTQTQQVVVNQILKLPALMEQDQLMRQDQKTLGLFIS